MLVSLIYSLGMLIVLPIVFIITLWKASFKSRLEWLLDALTSTALVVWIFQSGNWSSVGYYFRFLLFAVLIIALVISWKKVRTLPFRIKYSTNQKVTLGVYTFLLFMFGMYNVFIITSYTTDEAAIELTFPLQDGTYYIGQGGNNVQMNYHQAHPAQKHALDILKLNKLGARANGLYPKELKKYKIYEEDLYSPCNGKVVEVQNELPDLTPPEADPENPTGNYVALSCENTDAILYLAHMQKGSVTVTQDEIVNVGKKIGQVGNSGNTSEPHLHIHAEKNGVGVPIQFNNRFLVRNSLMR
ncbi:M23 family metallopeptidase [Sporosarcina sp. FSL K6-1508]|uniref:M23 family metallopeptidase n=1 Tax=Sporosarcina sp. FSL K6-1508 TaxID=2921553 RepID=UPI0030F76125